MRVFIVPIRVAPTFSQVVEGQYYMAPISFVWLMSAFAIFELPRALEISQDIYIMHKYDHSYARYEHRYTCHATPFL